MNTDEERAKFETWLRKIGKHELDLMRNKSDVDGYAYYPTQCLWMGYQQATKEAEAEIERLREALTELVSINNINADFTGRNFAWAELQFANEALKEADR